MATRDNKYLRQANDRDKKNFARDAQPTIDEQLVRLEDDIRRLKIEFDIYFNGASKRPPYDTKNRVDSTIKRLADERKLSFAQRYFYNTLVARFTAFRELWRRTMQGREEGRDAASVTRSNAARARIHETTETPPTTFVCADVQREVPTMKKVFDTLMAAKKKCGEPVDDLSFPRFHRLMTEKTDALKSRLGCERVRFSIEVHDGRVSFKAKAAEEK